MSKVGARNAWPVPRTTTAATPPPTSPPAFSSGWPF